MAAIVVGGVVLWPRHAEHGPWPALRGGSGDVNGPTLRIRPAGIAVDGLHVAWKTIPGADESEVRVDSTLEIPAAELDFRPVAGRALLVPIDARGAGQFIASSPPTPFGVATLPD